MDNQNNRSGQPAQSYGYSAPPSYYPPPAQYTPQPVQPVQSYQPVQNYQPVQSYQPVQNYQPVQYGQPAQQLQPVQQTASGQIPASSQEPSAPSQRPVFQPIDKRVLNSCRHKAERRWYRRLVVLNIIIIIGAIGYFLYAFDDTREYMNDVYDAFVEEMEEAQSVESGDTGSTTGDTDKKDDSSDSKSDGKSDSKELNKVEEAAKDMPQSLSYLVEIILTILLIPFLVYYYFAQYRSMSVQITEKTYPEIYAIVEEYAQKLGMKKVPKIYMVQGNGVLNAFSTFIPFRQYIEVYADLLEVAYREYHDMATIRFIIAHEMGHIYYKHATMHYYYNIMFSQMIPILGSTASRAREYSCDRLAQLLSGSDGLDAMMSLTAGIHLYKQVDKQDYINHAVDVRGFFVFWYNLLIDHPIMTKRVLALVDPNRGSGKLY